MSPVLALGAACVKHARRSMPKRKLGYGQSGLHEVTAKIVDTKQLANMFVAISAVQRMRDIASVSG